MGPELANPKHAEACWRRDVPGRDRREEYADTIKTEGNEDALRYYSNPGTGKPAIERNTTEDGKEGKLMCYGRPLVSISSLSKSFPKCKNDLDVALCSSTSYVGRCL